jgi:hypothetical protein
LPASSEPSVAIRMCLYIAFSCSWCGQRTDGTAVDVDLHQALAPIDSVGPKLLQFLTLSFRGIEPLCAAIGFLRSVDPGEGEGHAMGKTRAQLFGRPRRPSLPALSRDDEQIGQRHRRPAGPPASPFQIVEVPVSSDLRKAARATDLRDCAQQACSMAGTRARPGLRNGR